MKGSDKCYQSTMLGVGKRASVRNCLQARLLLISPSLSPASFPNSPLESNKEAVAAGGTPGKQPRHTASGHGSSTECVRMASAEGLYTGFFLSEYETELRETTRTTSTTRRKVIPVGKKM